MSTKSIEIIAGVVLALGGMVGLYFGVEHSVWVLIVGLAGVLFS